MHIFHPFVRHFLPNFVFSCRTAYSIFKVVYQASLIPKIRKIYGLVAETCSKTHIFHTFFAIFGPKNFFLQNYLCHKVVNQASLIIPKIRKIYGLVAETCSKTHIFNTFFAIYGQKNFVSCKTAYAIFKVVY